MKTLFPFKTTRSFIYLFGLFATLGVLTLSSCLKDSDNDGEAVYSALTVIHGSPDTPPIDFVWDSQRVNNQEFAYGDRIMYFTDFSGIHIARFYEEGTNSDALYETQVQLSQGKYFSLFLSGTSADSLSAVLIEDDLTEPAEGNAKVRFLNLSPDAGALDFQLVDDSLAASNKEFEKYTSFQEMEAGEYSAVIKSHSGTAVNHPFNLTLEDGKIYTIWAKGLVAASGDEEQQFDHGIIKHLDN